LHVALGYAWLPHTTGYHLERSLIASGHRVSYAGLPAAGRPGFGQHVPVDQALAALPEPPDLYLWIDSGGPYFPPGIEDLPIPTAAYLVDVHIGAWRQAAARFFDLVFVAQKDHVAAYRQAAGHGQVSWLPLAAAPDYHGRHDLPPRYDIAFVGHVGPHHRRSPRLRRLRLLSQHFRTNDALAYCPPERIGQVYSQAKIVFNTSLAGDVNMRVFEAALSGALLLTDRVANGLDELFDLQREIVTYDTDDDLLAKARYYLEHETERAAIAGRGRARACAQHTYQHRADQVLQAAAAPGFQRCAPMRRASRAERWQARRKVYTHLRMLDSLLSGSRALGRNRLQRARDVLPCLLRELRR
jgi:hypothetical protein